MLLLSVVLLIVALVVLYFLFMRGGVEEAADKIDIDTKVELPDVDVDLPKTDPEPAK